ncbi:glycoside hydrolase family 5 protein, partial [Mariprofundus erugo]|uniref:glycoside hydrolase family 5 protein n=1 Tax=Mariprofundus erugo TaxID=2528639 RepID=UPI0010FDE8FD
MVYKLTSLKTFILIFTIIFSISCSSSNSQIEQNIDEEIIKETPNDEVLDNEDENTEDEQQTYNSVVEEYGQLTISGNKIVDQNGSAIQLRGMSFFWSQWIGKYYNHETVKWLKDDWQCTVVRAALAVDYDGYLVHPEQEKAKIMAVT